MSKEIEDALHMLLHCSLKDTEYETQFEQYKIVRDYITNLQQENKQLKGKLENYKQENKELKVNKNLNHVQKKEFEKLIHTNNRLIHCDEILTELEEWLQKEQERYRDYLSTRPENDSEYNSKYATQCGLAQVDVILDKIQELKEKYK